MKPRRPKKPGVVIFVIVSGIITILGAGSLAVAAGHTQILHPFTSVFYTDTTSGPVVQGIQNGNGIGVEGTVGVTAGAIGMAGFANNAATQNIGLEGVVKGPNSVGLLGQALSNNAATPSIGLEGTSNNGFGVVAQSLLAAGAGLLSTDLTNTSKGMLGIGGGAGAFGSAVHSNGVLGQTSNTSNTSLVSFAGVLGSDISNDTGKLNAGVAGTSINGTGVSAVSTKGLAASALSGTNAASLTLLVPTAISATDTLATANSVGIAGVSNVGNGIIGGSAAAAGLEGDAFVVAAPSVAGFNLAKGPTFIGQTLNPAGTTLFSTATIGATGTGPTSGTVFNEGMLGSGDIGVEADGASATAPALLAKATGGGPVFIANNGTTDVLSVDNAGNLIAKGTITTGTPITYILSASGHRMLGYSARQSQPTLEDFGEGNVRGGQGFVSIDPKFADSIDHRINYIVFITPEGDNRGLYVAQKLPTGFMVRESQGGHSTLAFGYRIVAKPVDITAPRFPDAQSAGRLGRAINPNIGNLVHPSYYGRPSLRFSPDSRVRLQRFAPGNIPDAARAPRGDRGGNVHLGPVTVHQH